MSFALTCTALASFAQTAPPFDRPADISGRWLFKTELRNKGCTISGEMTLTRLPRPLGYGCSFLAREECGQAGQTAWSEVKQSCVAFEIAGEFVITSKIEEILATYPSSRKAIMIAEGSYRPDHFRVRLAKNGDLVGTFKSINQAAVRFWRERDLVS